ncbi:ribonuclease P protein subunit p25-like protein isoform X2 [Antennarius striatus]
MENYARARSVERPSVCPFPDLPPDTPEVRVRDGSKIRNLLRYALSRVEPRPRTEEGLPTGEGGGAAEEEGQQEGRGRPPCRQIVFTATGKGVAKAVTCAEIVKRRLGGIHQLTRVQFSTLDEVWDPLEPGAGLDSLTVSRNRPALWILLSRDPLDPRQPGYQPPGRYDALWREDSPQGPPTAAGLKRKKGGGGRGRGHGRSAGPSREAKGPV